jgi:hypothetical protein
MSMKLAPSVALALALSLGPLACGSSDGDRRADAKDAGPDQASSSSGGAGAGAGGRTASGGAASGGAASGGTASGGTASGGTASGGAAPEGGLDGGLDASADGAPSDSGSDGQGDAGSGDGGDAAVVVVPEGVLTDVPYTCASPFTGVAFPSYFHLEDWEDGVLSTPGVTISANQLSSTFGAAYIDSIDCDDGVTDGACAGCEALWASGTVDLTFDATILGALPTHVGLVWTDGGYGTSVTITAYGSDDQVIDTQTATGIGDQSNAGTVAEDRFFGIVHLAGVKRVVVANNSGGLEIDHLQYGR